MKQNKVFITLKDKTMADSCCNDELEVPEKRDKLAVDGYIRPINNNLFYNHHDNNSYGCEVNSGDIICIFLDFISLWLSYIINEKDYGIAFKINKIKI